jgi:protein MpaA
MIVSTAALVGCIQARPAAYTGQTPPLPAVRALLGYSVEGRPIESFTFGHGPAPVLVLGGFHGNEQASVYVAEELVSMLNGSPTLLAGRCVVVVPNVNPDGYVRDTRKNVRGVDLNRNFPTGNWVPSDPRDGSHGGPASLSEPESQIVLDLVRHLEPGLIISIHSISRNRQCNNFDGPGEAVAALMATHNGYPVKPSIGYPTPGSFGTWAGRELGIPTITLELPRPAPAEECWATNREALVAAIQHEPAQSVALGK